MKIDCTVKRGRFIGKVKSLLQEFHFAKTTLCCRYVKFKEMLSHSTKPMFNLLARLVVDDKRTVMGKT